MVQKGIPTRWSLVPTFRKDSPRNISDFNYLANASPRQNGIRKMNINREILYKIKFSKYFQRMRFSSILLLLLRLSLLILLFFVPIKCVPGNGREDGSYNAGKSTFFVTDPAKVAVKMRERSVSLVGSLKKKNQPVERNARREGIVLDDLDSASEIFLNTYNYIPWYNKVIGEKHGIPAYHSSVKFRGKLWPGSGREIEIGANNNGRNHFNEDRVSTPKNYDLIESRYMGITQMRPQSIREYVGLVPPRRRRHSAGSRRGNIVDNNDTAAQQEGIGHKYKHYHVTNANCNMAANEILMKTLQRTAPTRNNRLTDKLGNRAHLNKLPLHRIGFG